MTDMTETNPEALIAELLATGEMNEDSVADLERMRADHQAGTLHPDDRSYLVAFYQRIMAGSVGEASDGVASSGEPEDLSSQLAAAIARAEAAEAEVARLNAVLNGRDGEPSGAGLQPD